ncbi:MAG: PolC-type DNA polymerase III [Defluviitaleaceae bacterium]|nr:PolC-type DNA polymerase III [Defluviitaleaceae bacterium]
MDYTTLIEEINPLSQALLQDARYEYDEVSAVVTVHLVKTGAFLLSAQGIGKMMEARAAAVCGTGVKITFVDPAAQPKTAPTPFPAQPQVPPTTSPNVASNIGTTGKSNKKPAPNAKKIFGSPNSENTYNRRTKMWGEHGSIKGTPTKLEEELIEGDDIVVAGEVFRFEAMRTRTGRMLYTFDITDGTDSVTVKFFTKDKNEFDENLSYVSKGNAVCVRGKVRYDEFARELLIMASQITPGKTKAKRADNAPVKRVELHCHTQMSQMDAMCSVGDVVKMAAAFGMPAVAITDHGNVHCFPDAQKAGKTHGIKIIYGMEGYLLDDLTPDKYGNTITNIKKMTSYHIIILVKNQTGMRNLYELITKSNMEFFRSRPRIPKSLLQEKREGLILGTACEAGEFYSAVLGNEPHDELVKIADFYDYIEIQTHRNNMYLVREGKVPSEQDLIDINKKIIDFGKSLGKPVCATCDTHFLEPEDAIYREIIMTGEGYKDAHLQAPLYFRTTEEMLAEFNYLSRGLAEEIVITNTNIIADMVEEPSPLPSGTYPLIIDGSEDELKEIASSRMANLYGDAPPAVVMARLEREMGSICKHGFASLYNAARILTERSIENGYLVGSRGSVGSSFAATMSGITEVNPLEAHYYCKSCRFSDFDSDEAKELRKRLPGLSGYDLPNKDCPECGTPLHKDGHEIMFEVFLGFDCDKEPDIDLNFSGDYQARAHAHATEMFGENNIFKAGTIGTLADKTAFGFVKKYHEGKGLAKRKAEQNRLVAGLVGVKRTTGQHPGGLIVVPQGHDIHEFCPIQRPADNQDSTITTTHFDYHSALEGRLMKLDILGHDAPTVIRLLHDYTGADPLEVDMGDETVMSMFNGSYVDPEGRRIGTIGIPEFGTGFVRQMLADTRPQSFTELVKISGLSHGTDVWLGNGAELISSGVTDLNGIVAARDDILINLVSKGMDRKFAFNMMEKVRKGKGLTNDEAEQMAGAGIPDWYIDSCNRIKYLFPKGHAVAYVMMSVRIAYYKLHYPLPFYAATLSVKSDEVDYEKMCKGPDVAAAELRRINALGKDATAKEKSAVTQLEIVLEMYERGFSFLPIDIYESHQSRFVPTPDGILPPLLTIAGLGSAAAAQIVTAREEEPFTSQQNFKDRTKISKTIMELFVTNGILDDIPESNQLTLF